MSDRRDNTNAPALATNGEERASADQHPAKHDRPAFARFNALKLPRGSLERPSYLLCWGLVPSATAFRRHARWPDHLPRRGALRVIEAIFLIVGIFTVPIAYYFWMGSWHTIPGAPAPELASFSAKPIIPPRKPSGEEETTTARDRGTPAKLEPRTAKSSAGETAAMLQPDTPGAQAASPLDQPKPSSEEELDLAQEARP